MLTDFWFNLSQVALGKESRVEGTHCCTFEGSTDLRSEFESGETESWLVYILIAFRVAERKAG